MKHYKKRTIKKIFIIAMLIVAQLLMLSLYNINEDFISNTKASYAASVYYPMYKNKMSQLLHRDSQIAKTGEASEIPVLLYHGIVDREDGSNVLLDNFRDQMFELKKAGYATVTLSDYYEFIKGNKKMSEKSFLLTFDDGRKDSYYPVDTILKELGFNASIFVITENINDEESGFYLHKKELQKMIQSGRWEIQSHSNKGHGMIDTGQSGLKGHYFSNRELMTDNLLESMEEYTSRITNDLSQSKFDLKNSLNVISYAYAYPYGDYGQASQNIKIDDALLEDITEKQFGLTFRQAWYENEYCFNNVGDFDSKRIEVGPNWDARNLLFVLKNVSKKTIPFNDKFTDFSGWIRAWGDLDLQNTGMVIQSNTLSNGAGTYLSGSNNWKDYSMTANVNWMKGEAFSVLAQYQNNKNYIIFTIAEESIRVEQVVNGESKILSEIKRHFDEDRNNFLIGISIHNNKIVGRINNKILIEIDKQANEIKSGSIGFQIWDSVKNNSKLIIEKVDVSTEWSDLAQLQNIYGIKEFPYSMDILSQDQGWIKTWGNMSYLNNELILESTSKTTGAATYLAGASEWQDYSYQLNFNWLKGSNVILMARYLDDKNYVSLNISKDYIRVEQKIDNKTEILLERKTEFSINPKSDNFKINVSGGQITAYHNNDEIIESTMINKKFSKGAIGLKIWDKISGNSKIMVNKISVESIK